MPQMGYDMQEGTLVRWLKGIGDEVKLGEAIAEIETDKAVIEFESTTSGVVKKIIVDEGSIVPVGQPVIVIGLSEEEIQENSIDNSNIQTEPVKNNLTEENAIAEPKTEEKIESKTRKISPAARRIANENNIDLSSISGSGPGNRITRDDVILVISSGNNQKSPEGNIPPNSIKQNKIREQIARVTTKSKREIPHFYLTNEIDMTVAMRFRDKINKQLETKSIKVSVNDLIIAGAVEALKKFPEFNSTYVDDSPIIHEEINIGIAISTAEGLIVPAILGCEKKSLEEIAISSKDLIYRSNNGTLSSKEYTDGTFSISNLGMYNISSFSAIILPPQICMLATGTVEKKPIVSSNEIVIADIMTATLSGDHRVTNGAKGAKLLEAFKEILENPTFINI